MKKIIVILFLSFILVSPLKASSPFALGLDLGGAFPLSKNDQYTASFYVGPKLEIPGMFFSYNYYTEIADVSTGSIDLHTFNVGVRRDIGDAIIIPYFAAGGGFALFNAPGTYLNGMTFFGIFGLDYKLDRLIKSNRMTMGIFARYNSLLFESKELFAPGDDFKFHQMITSAFNVSIYF